jgi:hypothetical protein
MESTINSLEVMLRKRQHALWLKIVKEFEVEHSLNIQVQTWIREGRVSEKAYDRAQKRRVRSRS